MLLIVRILFALCLSFLDQNHKVDVIPGNDLFSEVVRVQFAHFLH